MTDTSLSFQFIPNRPLSMIRHVLVLLSVFVLVCGSPTLANTSVDDLPDLTGGVVPVIHYKDHHSFPGKDLTSVSLVEYVVRVKNQTGNPLVADSLIIVVDMVQGISGKDISDRLTIEGFDGVTGDGKPFFRIPSSDKELPPYHESAPVTIRVSNPDYLRFFPPSVRVYGLRRSPEEAVKGLVESLVQKGVLAPEEAVKVLESSSSGSP